MKSIVYQCWVGPMRSGVEASKANMEEYCARIGADYRFDHNPHIASKLCDVPIYYEPFNMLVDPAFEEYDKVAAVDMDVFAVDGLTESLFDVPCGEIGICTEPYQPDYRASLHGHICKDKDELWAKIIKQKWGADMPRTEKGLLKVYNTGVVVFSKDGLRKAKEKFVPFQQYIDLMRTPRLSKFYTLAQDYVHAMLEVAHMAYVEMDNGWNSYVHYIGDPAEVPRPVNDCRTKDTRFVHIQLRGADDYDAEKLWRVTNKPQAEW